MKYDSQLIELKTLLPTAKNILIAISAGSDIDQLAAGLSLFLLFEAQGKQVSIVCDDVIRVGQSHLFGVDHVQKNVPSTEGGHLTLVLEGVAASDGTVPALEKLDWATDGNNLNLLFHVLPGQTFQPARIIPRYQGSGFDLIFVTGAVNLNSLGGVYQQNQNAFSGTHVVNIDNESANTSFGQTNVLDTNATTVSEITCNVILDLGLNLDADSASNLLAGIFDKTGNLMSPNVTADTYMAVAQCLRVGGRKPAGGQQVVTPAVPAYDWNALVSKDQPQPQVQSIPQSQSVVDAGDHESVAQQAPQPSPEERPLEEGVISETVEPEWLTPKIFKGSSLG